MKRHLQSLQNGASTLADVSLRGSRTGQQRNRTPHLELVGFANPRGHDLEALHETYVGTYQVEVVLEQIFVIGAHVQRDSKRLGRADLSV